MKDADELRHTETQYRDAMSYGVRPEEPGQIPVTPKEKEETKDEVLRIP